MQRLSAAAQGSQRGSRGKAAFLQRACSAARVGDFITSFSIGHFRTTWRAWKRLWITGTSSPSTHQAHFDFQVGAGGGGECSKRYKKEPLPEGNMFSACPGTPPARGSLAKAKWIRSTCICESERERCGRKRTHTDTHSSHHHLHSRFLKSSHISVTIATLLSPSPFHSCFFPL